MKELKENLKRLCFDIYDFAWLDLRLVLVWIFTRPRCCKCGAHIYIDRFIYDRRSNDEQQCCDCYADACYIAIHGDGSFERSAAKLKAAIRQAERTLSN